MARKINNEKESLVLYTNQYDAVQGLSLEQKGLLFDTIFQYFKTNQEPAIKDKEVKIAFGFIRLQLDRDNQKYAEVCEKRRASIQKRWNTNEYKRIQMNTNEHDNDNENESDNENENDLQDTKVSMSKEAKASIKKEKKRAREEIEKKEKSFIELFKESWNYWHEKIPNTQTPEIKALTQERKKLIYEIGEMFKTADGTIDTAAVTKGIRYAMNSKRVQNVEKKGSPADVTYLLKNFIKLVEGTF